ncbi:MAG TPA: carboxylating nicotinate-nucleotide diphosphorylase [Woeseiaceae bacterium]|nr:carboxylating nicotinate-nucleotide diphosphorylase [Woeseiaceae bacterium]
MSTGSPDLDRTVRKNVADALAEDVGSGDLTASLLPESATARASIVTREAMTLAGRPWVDEVYRQLDPSVRLDWQAADGDGLAAGAALCRLEGPARALLTGERTALNFLQLLSGTATVAASYAAAVAETNCRILDTRKTIPGLRVAQKYAVRCGGGVNHRLGLFDAILIKENHVLSAGGIEAAIRKARATHPGLPIETEVETITELREALRAHADRLLLDNFMLDDLRRAVEINRAEGDPPAELEASGGLTLENVAEVAASGVDFISVGALTKHVAAIDLSMRVDL